MTKVEIFTDEDNMCDASEVFEQLTEKELFYELCDVVGTNHLTPKSQLLVLLSNYFKGINE